MSAPLMSSTSRPSSSEKLGARETPVSTLPALAMLEARPAARQSVRPAALPSFFSHAGWTRYLIHSVVARVDGSRR
eukprot:3676340-Prymnesium_polylepis.1